MSNDASPELDETVIGILSKALNRQADAMESAGKATAAEVRSMNNRLTLIVVIAMALNTAMVVGSLSLDFSEGTLSVDGVDAANAVVHQVENGTLPETLVFPAPEPDPPPVAPSLPAAPEPWRDEWPEPMERPSPLPPPRQRRDPVPAPYELPHTTPMEP